MVVAEEHAAQAEEGDGDSRADPARRVVRGGEPKAKIDGIAGLHTHEAAPYLHAAAVQEAGDNVASQQYQVAPVLTDILGEICPEVRDDGALALVLGKQGRPFHVRVVEEAIAGNLVPVGDRAVVACHISRNHGLWRSALLKYGLMGIAGVSVAPAGVAGERAWRALAGVLCAQTTGSRTKSLGGLRRVVRMNCSGLLRRYIAASCQTRRARPSNGRRGNAEAGEVRSANSLMERRCNRTSLVV